MDLFDMPSCYSFAHCVSKDFKMGAGIAKEFRNRYGRVSHLISQEKEIGEVAFLNISEKEHAFYLITKERFFHKPTYDSLEKSLCYLRYLCIDMGVTQLAIPRLGCGLDKLRWERVSEIIENCFENTGINIVVCYL